MIKDAIILGLLALLAALALTVSGAPEPAIEDVSAAPADFPVCVTIKPPPLLRSPHGRIEYRPGVPFNDKGNV